MNRVIRVIATGFGSGYCPYLPGTAGSLVAVLISYYCRFELWQILLLSFFGVYICQKAELLLQQHDSPHIVFDEFCGIFIATWKAASPLAFLTAFILFRLFDMLKPYPINKLQELSGGWGVMADDIGAGIAARVILGLIF